MFVKEIMSRKIAAIDGEKTILEASKIYRDRKVGSVFITLKDELTEFVTLSHIAYSMPSFKNFLKEQNITIS